MMSMYAAALADEDELESKRLRKSQIPEKLRRGMAEAKRSLLKE